MNTGAMGPGRFGKLAGRTLGSGSDGGSSRGGEVTVGVVFGSGKCGANGFRPLPLPLLNDEPEPVEDTEPLRLLTLIPRRLVSRREENLSPIELAAMDAIEVEDESLLMELGNVWNTADGRRLRSGLSLA
jgi:hypothetical protein